MRVHNSASWCTSSPSSSAASARRAPATNALPAQGQRDGLLHLVDGLARALVVHDGRAIHGIFQVQDRYVRCVRKEYHSEVWKDSCVEFFAEPKPGRGYFNFEFNCGGAFLCNHIVDPARTADGFKEFEGLVHEAAVRLTGSPLVPFGGHLLDLTPTRASQSGATSRGVRHRSARARR